jgi:DNA-binding NtrC family response regulator
MLPPPLDGISIGEKADTNDVPHHIKTGQENDGTVDVDAFSTRDARFGRYDVRALKRSERETSVVLGVIKQMLHDGKDVPNPREPCDIKALWKVEMEAIEEAIKLCGDNIPQAAKSLGVSPSIIYRKRQAWKSNGGLTDGC